MARARVLNGSVPVFAGALLSIALGVVVAALPAYIWSPAALLTVGGLAAAASALVFKGHHTLIPPSLRHILGLFMLVYGVCAMGGGLAGHYSPTTPLKAVQITAPATTTLWSTAKSLEEAQRLIGAATTSNQKSLLFWAEDDCDRCQKALALGVLNPSVNPSLRGYRLIRIESTEHGMEALRELFGAFGRPALTLMRADGTVPDHGRLNKTIDAQRVMDLLDLEDQAEKSNM